MEPDQEKESGQRDGDLSRDPYIGPLHRAAMAEGEGMPAAEKPGRKGSFDRNRRKIGFWLFLISVFLMIAYLTVGHSLNQSQVQAGQSSLSRTDLGNGWIRYEKDDPPAFAISLPGDWAATGMSPGELEQYEDRLQKTDPDAARQLQDPEIRQFYECCMRLMAADSSKVNLDIEVEPLDPGTSLESYLQKNINVIAQQFDIGEAIKPAPASIKAGAGYSVTVINRRANPAGARWVNQLYLAKDGNAVVLTFKMDTADQAAIGAQTQVFGQIEDSLEWK